MGSFLLGILGGCCLSGGVLLLLNAPEKKGSRKAQIPATISFCCPYCETENKMDYLRYLEECEIVGSREVIRCERCGNVLEIAEMEEEGIWESKSR